MICFAIRAWYRRAQYSLYILLAGLVDSFVYLQLHIMKTTIWFCIADAGLSQYSVDGAGDVSRGGDRREVSILRSSRLVQA